MKYEKHNSVIVIILTISIFLSHSVLILMPGNYSVIADQMLYSDEDLDGLNLTEEMSLGTDPTQKDLFIEVDFLNSNKSSVIESFNDVKSLFLQYNVNVWIDYDSPNNFINYIPNLYNNHLAFGVIERLYHDYPWTHIYIIIADNHPFIYGAYGDATAEYGIIIDMEFINDNTKIAGILMHEIGHSIGAGLHDDVNGDEVYSYDGFMSYNPYDFTSYDSVDWNDTFAPDNYFLDLGDSKRYDARFWNKASIRGELGDERALVTGTVRSSNGSVIPTSIVVMKSEVGKGHQYNYEGEVSQKGEFYVFVPPGESTIIFTGLNDLGEVIEEYDYEINISKYKISKEIEITLNKIEKEPPWIYMAVILVFVVFGIIRYSIKSKGHQ